MGYIIALVLIAAPGDTIYEVGGGTSQITAGQALCFADCAIADGSWTGVRANMTRACAERDSSTTTGFAAYATGLRKALPANVPDGAVKKGVDGVQMIYELPTTRITVTAGQALCYADCAIAAGSWDDARNRMISTCAQRDDGYLSGFSAYTVGLKSAPLAEVPDGAVTRGVE